MIPAESPPIRVSLFVAQTYDDAEYYRDLKPDGSPYQAVDCASGKTYHCGYDEQGDLNEPLLSMTDGNVYFIDKGPAYGIQTALVPSGTDYAWFYAHQSRRFQGDGALVKAGNEIGIMGTTGGVQRHLHLGTLQPRTKNCWFNPGPVLRALKASLLHPPSPLPSQEEDMILFKKATVSTVYAWLPGNKRVVVPTHQLNVIAGVLGHVPTVHVVPDNHEWLSLPLAP